MLQIILGAILGALIYYLVIKPLGFWDSKGIPHVKSAWPIVGNFKDFALRRRHFSEITNDIYKNFPNDRYVGFLQFSAPALLIRDLDLIKQIAVKEFEHFHDHMGFAKADFDPLLSKSLVHLRGDDWKQMRATLSPAFTGSKMRSMYSLMVECSENFCKYFEGKEQVDVEMKDLFSRFANDVIATAAFGIQVNTVKDPDHEFYLMGKKLTAFNLAQTVKMFLFTVSPKLAKMLHVRLLPQDISDFFASIIASNIDRRRKEGIIRPDLIHLLLEAQKGRLTHDFQEDKQAGFATVEESQIGRNSQQMELTDDHIIAQALLFFFAGLETVSNSACVIAHELAANPDVQKKLQNEIDAVNSKNPGLGVPYDALLSMKYLDQVICETLRMWPPGFQTDRLCNRDYLVKARSSKENDFVIEKGMLAVIPIMGLQRDPQYFENPDKFDPERFSDENKSKIIPGTYMPFGLGPRNCIGSRFALLELKTLFFHLLASYDIATNEKTVLPLKVSPKKVTISPEEGFQLRLVRRKLTTK